MKKALFLFSFLFILAGCGQKTQPTTETKSAEVKKEIPAKKEVVKEEIKNENSVDNEMIDEEVKSDKKDENVYIK